MRVLRGYPRRGVPKGVAAINNVIRRNGCSYCVNYMDSFNLYESGGAVKDFYKEMMRETKHLRRFVFRRTPKDEVDYNMLLREKVISRAKDGAVFLRGKF